MLVNPGAISPVLRYLVGAIAILAYGIYAYSFGYHNAEKTYTAQIAVAEAERVKAVLAAEEKARKKEGEDAKEIAAALSARDKALSAASDLRRSADRVRQQSAAVSASLSRAGEADHSAGGRDSVRLGNCERLLGESAALLGEGQELAGEGAALSARLSADKDALKAGAR